MSEKLVPADRLAQALARATDNDAWLGLVCTLIEGGKSNLSFLVHSGAGDMVLRRPPTGNLLPTAHDMLREARVQQALADTAVPTAKVVLVDDGHLIGVPCYVMERVEGHVIRGQLPDGYADRPEDRLALALGFVDTMTALHAVDFTAVGLADFGHPEGFVKRQVDRWTRQWQASRVHPVPEIDELSRGLADTLPAQQRATIVHGDYRLDNVVLHPDDPGRINAVLDWELSALGDPMTDLALFLLFWREADEPALTLNPGVSHLAGFPSRADLLDRYADVSGVDLTDLDWYLAFAHFKFAVVSHGVAARSKAGAMAGQDFGDLDSEVLLLAQRGLAYL